MNPSRWYVIQTYSGMEQKVEKLLREELERRNVLEKVHEIFIPTEKVLEFKNGTQVEKNKAYFPGYIFINMVLDNDIIYIIKSIPKVSGLVGMNGIPSPLPECEIKKITERINESSKNPRNAIRYVVGGQVKISDGPFASFTGQIDDIDEKKQELKVSVMIFGRATPVTLRYDQVEKI